MPPKKKKRKAKKGGGSNVFDHFTQRQVAEFKAGFQLIDHNKDGKITAEDLDWTWKHVGKQATDEEIQLMLSDSVTTINFTMLMKLFADKASGEQDDDEVVVKAFKTFANADDMIDAKFLNENLTSYADRYTKQEAQDFMDMMPIDSKGFINCEKIIKLLTGPAEDEPEGEGEGGAPTEESA